MPASVEILVGYLVTHADGYQARLAPDLTRAELYAARQHATIEPMYVRRPAHPAASSTVLVGPLADYGVCEFTFGLRLPRLPSRAPSP